MKTCTQCCGVLELSCFSTNGTTRTGAVSYNSRCKSCRASAAREGRSFCCQSCGAVSLADGGKPGRHGLCAACYPAHRKQRVADCRREWERRVRLSQPKLPGISEEIGRIYAARPEGHQVDHIVPLQGQNVCGLHAPWNLQYLTPEENRKKGNRV